MFIDANMFIFNTKTREIDKPAIRLFFFSYHFYILSGGSRLKPRGGGVGGFFSFCHFFTLPKIRGNGGRPTTNPPLCDVKKKSIIAGQSRP